ncbi:hypothetical protein RCO48_28850 [Peribacillus frigoritolerans]|nr:hypothetical protein [Peribacillus frigoritolerans]
MKKKVAIIGGGQTAEKVHVPYYLTREEVEIVAVVGRNMERTKKLCDTERNCSLIYGCR